MRHKARLSGVRILITGRTGFTGSWACLRFSALGAEIHGYALAPDTKPALFDLADVWPSLKSHTLGDLADFDLLLETVRRVQPDLILHLAAQPLVLAGYAAPVRTFMTNTQGTAHVLEAARQIKSVMGVVAVTTDKVYAPDEAALPYAEDARLGGTDPYSASKAAAEMIISGYRHAMPAWDRAFKIETARGGNIIGGGDFSADRIVPDFVRALERQTSLVLRRPEARRPWQHVLDLIEGYRLLLERCLETNRGDLGQAWNFGPSREDAVTVATLIARLQDRWKPIALDLREGPPETKILAINAEKSRKILGWRPRLYFDGMIDATVEWYRVALQTPDELPALTRAQIEHYETLGA